MGDDDKENVNSVVMAFCPICGRKMQWLLDDPIDFPGADYMAYCVYCDREFGVSIKELV